MLLKQKDMTHNGKVLKNHGSSFSLLRNGDVLIYHQSDLTSNILRREMVIYCEKDICINVEYSIYDKNLNCLKNSRVCVLKNKKLIFDKEIIDDNMYYCLNSYYDCLENDKYNEIYKQRILNFSKIMLEYKEFSENYCK